DKRTDIWAFGCVLFEMLTGRAAFPGETLSDTIAAVLEREPDWTALPKSKPRRTRVLLRRCLDKDPKQRLQDIGDVRLELLREGDEDVSATSGPRIFQWTKTSVAVIALAFLAGTVVSLVLGKFLGPGSHSNLTATSVRFSVSPPLGSVF